MKLIVGLGNPGKKYERTRHNVGFVVVDKLVQKIQLPKFKNDKRLQSLITIQKSLVLAKPQTFMNSSGIAVQELLAHFKVKLPDLWVIHDDLDLRLGSYKIQKGKGPKQHNGLLSIYQKLGSKNFWHIRVGVDNRENIDSNDLHIPTGEEYVLQNFKDEELDIMNNVIDKIVEELEKII